jgi:hypothetical protein
LSSPLPGDFGSKVVERLEREHGRVVITKHGRPAAVEFIYGALADDPHGLGGRSGSSSRVCTAPTEGITGSNTASMRHRRVHILAVDFSP